MSRFHRADRRAGSRSGVAAVEFALLVPFVVLVMLAGADLSLFMRTVMQMDETSTELAQTVTQYQNLYNGDFTTLFNASQTIAGTTPVTGLLGATIISGIVNNAGKTDDRLAEGSAPPPRSPACSASPAPCRSCRTTTLCRPAAR